MTTTVISHFYNEEYLLPWWLAHNRERFDHGILIDYGSTDNSVAICKEMVPDWEVRPSRNEMFTAIEVDREVTDIERGIEGWKTALNTTEFYVGRFPEDDATPAIRVPAVIMVDTQRGTKLDRSVPLIEQCQTGYFESDHAGITIAANGRGRLIHRHEHGGYIVGRHATTHAAVGHTDDALILWFGYAPWNAEMHERKMQIQTRMPESDKLGGFGVQHVTDDASLEEAWERVKSFAGDLTSDERYARVIGK